MVITDDLAVTMSENPVPLRMAPKETPGEPRDVVLSLEREGAVVTGRVTLADYDFVKPKTSLESTSEGKGTGELYRYPGPHVTKDEGEALARRLLEGREWPRDLVRGASACPRLGCGTRFALEDHARAAYNSEYRVLELVHEAEFGGWRSSAEPGVFSYRSDFVAIPTGVPYRPRRIARKPRVPGVQSAVVVGKAGEEIWTDKYGRVKLQFHWDREGKRDENSSCWVRVSSLWAGKNWGAVQLPRIGQEVIVEFLDGDIDRPIVTGRVYNDDQMPPYTLPDNQTQSGLKTRSSKGGKPANANELRFEDKDGSEEILLHAERDLTIEVEHDAKTTVGHDATTTVDHDEKVTIKHDRTDEVQNDEKTTVRHNRTDEVQGDETRKVVGKRSVEVLQTDELKVMQDRTEKVAMSLEVQAGTTLTLKAGVELKLESPGGTITIGPAGISIQSPMMVTVKGPMVMIN
jgi:type VI secretion system secreted protein VgrG